MEQVMAVLGSVSEFLWGPWTPWVLLSAGLIFTVWTRFTQYNALTHGVMVVRGIYDDPNETGAINHFQALSAALSATVGLGNIGGVALAISMGGPGAVVWMWLTGLFGMALKTIEITLAMMYRNTDDRNNPSGGAMWVVDKVIGGKGGIWKPISRGIGIFFCITLIISTFTGGNMFQAWNVAALTESYFGVPRIAVGIVLGVLVGMVILGGITRIGSVAGRLVPFMCLLYLLSALAVLAHQYAEIPGMFALIFSSAFNPEEASGAFLGGTVGYAFSQGMKRALFSNEAGQGSSPIAHSAAKTEEPAREGIVGGLEPFIDTICICTLTALVIISTGTWNRPALGDYSGEIALQQDSSARVPTWNVVGGTDAAALPDARFREWIVGSQIFMVAQVEGATHEESGRKHVTVEGELVESQTTVGSDRVPQLAIQWSPVTLPASAWEGVPIGVSIRDRGIYRNYDGASLTGLAFDRAFPGLGKWLVTLAAWLFALSTMISWSYYGEQGVVYITGGRGVMLYRVIFVFMSVYACSALKNTSDMIILMDLGTGAMLWANIPIVLGLGYLAVGSLNDYVRRLKAGEFHPHKKPPLVDVVEGRDV